MPCVSLGQQSIKEQSSPLFLWTCAWFTIRPHVTNCNSLLLPNKPILLENIWLFVYGQHYLVAHMGNQGRPPTVLRPVSKQVRYHRVK